MSKVTQISPSTLNDMLKAKTVFLIDVREADEYKSEHIAEAHLFPKSTLDPNAVFKAADKHTDICVQCLSGGRSAQVAKVLEDALPEGSSVKLYNLVGGIGAWKAAGLPTVQ